MSKPYEWCPQSCADNDDRDTDCQQCRQWRNETGPTSKKEVKPVSTLDRLKELIGKEVCLVPTGNLARRTLGKSQEHKIATVVKVARVFITLKTYHEEKYRIGREWDGGVSIDAGFNGGYILYFDHKDLVDRQEIRKLAKLISNKYKYASDYEQLSLYQLKIIANSMEVE